ATTATLNRSLIAPVGPVPFHIIRQTRPIAGEEPVLLPQNVAVNIDLMNGAGLSLFQVPVRGNTGALIYEIVFDPSGGVVNRAEGTPIVLWINDETAADPAEAATTKLISIHPRTGLIATHPRASGGDPLAYIKDGRSSE
ncbi:MAG: hypothetical protein K2W96_19235, partial [Gemmataceae bacterium]|nr:hypothetical protein [Gemmataceae bacterium]